jgi:hypothetical protein
MEHLSGAPASGTYKVKGVLLNRYDNVTFRMNSGINLKKPHRFAQAPKQGKKMPRSDALVLLFLGAINPVCQAAQTCQTLSLAPVSGLCSNKTIRTSACNEGAISTATLTKLKSMAESAGAGTCKSFFNEDHCKRVSPTKGQVFRNQLIAL